MKWRSFCTPLLWFAFILLPLPYWKQHKEIQNNRRAVVICFHFTTFAVLETAYGRICPWPPWLWFAFILLPLPYWKQRFLFRVIEHFCCDLLSFYYLCRTGNSHQRVGHLLVLVVICFHFTTFAVLETASLHEWRYPVRLWFAFILLPLPYWKQPPTNPPGSRTVVICFHFTTFAVLETASFAVVIIITLLWFAFILLPLPYWKQLSFVLSSGYLGCDLLSFYYLCRTGNSCSRIIKNLDMVVICFHFTTFAVLETASPCRTCWMRWLWFAFILLPLPYWKQRITSASTSAAGCDLLSFYYLCRTGNSWKMKIRCLMPVVICFHFTTFAVLETANSQRALCYIVLWFAFILLPLPYWKQRHNFRRNLRLGCDLLSFYYLCRTGNSQTRARSRTCRVVICFHFTTFAVLETAFSTQKLFG